MTGIKPTLITALILVLTFSNSVDARKKGTRLLAGAAAVALVASDPLGKKQPYQPPSSPTHLLDSSTGNLKGAVPGAFLCFAEAKAEQNFYGADRAGAVFHHQGQIYFVPMWNYGRGGNLLAAKFQIYPASQSEGGLVRSGDKLDEDLGNLWDCWSSKKWKWSDHALMVEALPQYKTPQQLAAEKKEADLKAGKILSGPNNSVEWARRAQKAFTSLENKYPAYTSLWPAYELFLEMVRDTQQLPNISGAPFQDYCANDLDRSNKAMINQMSADYGFQLCGPASENWHNLLSWYHPALKDFRQVSNWTHFGYYKEPQKLIFSQKDVIEDWYLGDSLITKSYHYLFQFAERANMRVAGIVTGDGKKYTSAGTFSSFYNEASAEIEAKLFDSVANQRDIDTNIRSWGLFPELMTFFAATLTDQSLYADVIEAYQSELAEFTLESAAEREYKYYFGAKLIVDACHDTRGLLTYRKYLEKDEIADASAKWKEFVRHSPLAKSDQEAAEQDVYDEYLPTLVYLEEEGTLEFSSETREFCRENYLALNFMPAVSSVGETSLESAVSLSACEIARSQLAEAETMDQLELAKVKVDVVCD
jgi:hypothetical protein